MQRLYFFLSIIVVAFLFVGCAPRAIAQAGEISAPSDSAQSNNSVSADLPATSETASKDPPADCPLTVPPDPAFTPPSPYSELGVEGAFWLGSDSLWTAIPQNGIWSGLPHNREGYTQKVFWWREGYVWNEEPKPELIVTGERLDASAPLLAVSKATNAYASDIGSAMLVGVDFPTPGCWKIIGQYKQSELSFVVWIAP